MLIGNLLELFQWYAPAFGGGGGGNSGPDPYAQRLQRLQQSEKQVNDVFGRYGETSDQRLDRLRSSYISGKATPVGPLPIGRGAAQWTAKQKAAADGAPQLNADADAYIAGERAKGPGQFTSEWYEGQRSKFMDAQMPDLERQYRDRSQKETLWAWDKGLGQSTEAGKSSGALQRTLDQARSKVIGNADNYVNELRGKVETARNNAIMMGGDSDVGSSARFAGQQADLLSRPAPFSPVGDFFSGLITPAAMAVQAQMIRSSGRDASSLLSFGGTGGKGAVRNVTPPRFLLPN